MGRVCCRSQVLQRTGIPSQKRSAPNDTSASASTAVDVEPTFLYSKNVDVDCMNSQKLRQLRGELQRYTAEDSGKSQHHIKTLDKFCHSPKVLDLKIGAQVMLVKTVDAKTGLVNGARGNFRCFSRRWHVIPASLTHHKGDTPLHHWCCRSGDGVPQHTLRHGRP
jgi:hypothetical protein